MEEWEYNDKLSCLLVAFFYLCSIIINEDIVILLI